MPRNMFENLSDTNPWSEYRRMVMQALQDLNEDVEKVETSVNTNNSEIWTKVSKMEIQFTADITSLQVKAGVVGGISGMIAAGIIAIILKVVFKI